MNTWRKFELCVSFDNEVMVFPCLFKCVWKIPFRKSGHIFCFVILMVAVFVDSDDQTMTNKAVKRVHQQESEGKLRNKESQHGKNVIYRKFNILAIT